MLKYGSFFLPNFWFSEYLGFSAYCKSYTAAREEYVGLFERPVISLFEKFIFSKIYLKFTNFYELYCQKSQFFEIFSVYHRDIMTARRKMLYIPFERPLKMTRLAHLLFFLNALSEGYEWNRPKRVIFCFSFSLIIPYGGRIFKKYY